jgi:hypothetical protein
MRSSQFTCLFAAAFMTITPYTPQQFLLLAKGQTDISAKISILKRLTRSFPLDSSARDAESHMVDLLISTNRYEEALLEYRREHPDTGSGRAIDFKLLELLLRTGRYNEVLRATSAASGPVKDFIRDMKILELRVQALLAKGQYGVARECVDQWLQSYTEEGVLGSRFENDVRSIQFLKRHLETLIRLQGPVDKAIFTASVPDSLQHWSKRRNVPIVFFKLIPTHPAGQLHEPLLAGLHVDEDYFIDRVADLNRGFDYVSGDQFALQFAGLHTLYVKEGDMDPESSGGHLLTSRVYMHTIPQLYKLAGEAFVVLLDYRTRSDGEAAYMGDGLIHLSASKMQTLVMMHEILHGLGATHQDWNSLQAEGYRFDPEERGLMTFDHGEILDLGLEEKNRALLGWPKVGVVRPRFTSDSEDVAQLKEGPAAPSQISPEEATTAFVPATLPKSSQLIPSL